jgi:hypothetical protein
MFEFSNFLFLSFDTYFEENFEGCESLDSKENCCGENISEKFV